MYSYYICRGHKLEELINMSYVDKLFYLSSMELEEEHKVAFYNAFLGGDK